MAIPLTVEETHDTNSIDCWCRPRLVCAECEALGDCLHGAAGHPEKAEIVVHRSGN